MGHPVKFRIGKIYQIALFYFLYNLHSNGSYLLHELVPNYAFMYISCGHSLEPIRYCQFREREERGFLTYLSLFLSIPLSLSHSFSLSLSLSLLPEHPIERCLFRLAVCPAGTRLSYGFLFSRKGISMKNI